MKIRCVVVDDEPLALKKMKTYIEKIPYLDCLDMFDNAMDCLNFIKSYHIDLLFLDIQMDDLTGIQLLEMLKDKPKVILTTAYDQYALKGYELDVNDYLLKPIAFNRFLKAVEKIYRQLETESPDNLTEAMAKEGTKDRYIFIKADYKLQKINLSDILYIEGMKDYLRIVTPQKKLMTLMSFSKIIELLPERDFYRVHKSFIISLDNIDHISKNAVKIGDEMIPVSETYKDSFFNFLKSRNLMN